MERTIVAIDAPIFMPRQLMCHKRSLGKFLSRKRTYILIVKLYLPLQWLMLSCSYMLWLVAITTVVSMDAMKGSKARVLLHECSDTFPIPAHVLNNLKIFVIKYVFGSKELGCAEARVTQWEKNEKEEHSKANAKSRYVKPYLFTWNLSCILLKELLSQLSSLSNWIWLGNHWWKMLPNEKRFTWITSQFTIPECTEWWRQQW